LSLAKSQNHGIIGSATVLEVYTNSLKSREDIKNQFIFQLGELHILFAMLKVIGKNINQSGLEEVLIEAEIYDPDTLE
jgi:hypothetical protein